MIPRDVGLAPHERIRGRIVTPLYVPFRGLLCHVNGVARLPINILDSGTIADC